ncbi:carboxypeptidase-like regulatory domain-containing protein [Sphingopyxis sp.]|uniref:carboxypeptidase-like regulatory domain-containing protein n=1 Tax=Sphingopyxis sp. TaxID=1908224 RepID=UPI00261D1FFB|nr:carboxypeptidase-like regulatory domain-containing protein [Sphingopyxis sp.]MCW0198710.1 carboxypeptidase-like regulatory domain-containing protein [Sphingopyxis sp.]
MKDLRVTFPDPCDQDWSDMPSRGCNRFCAQCDRTIFDLSNLDIDQAEVMLAVEGRVCVRARVDSEGAVELRRKSTANVRRMILAVGTSVGMLMAAGHAAAKEQAPQGEIVGKLDTMWPYGMVITARSPDGREYRSKVKRDGGYRIKKLPPGTYSLEISGGCGKDWDGGTVVVHDREAARHDATDPNDCIIVGMIEVVQDKG